MKNMRRIGALFSGMILYSAALGVADVLSGVRLSREFYAAVGGRAGMPVVIGQAVLIGLLLFLLSLGWCYLTMKPPRRGRRPTTAWCLSGLALGWLGWLVYGVFYLSAAMKATNLPVITLLLSSTMAPMWGVLNIVGVFAGAVLAGRIVRKYRHRLAEPKPAAPPAGAPGAPDA